MIDRNRHSILGQQAAASHDPAPPSRPGDADAFVSPLFRKDDPVGALRQWGSILEARESLSPQDIAKLRGLRLHDVADRDATARRIVNHAAQLGSQALLVGEKHGDRRLALQQMAIIDAAVSKGFNVFLSEMPQWAADASFGDSCALLVALNGNGGVINSLEKGTSDELVGEADLLVEAYARSKGMEVKFSPQLLGLEPEAVDTNFRNRIRAEVDRGKRPVAVMGAYHTKGVLDELTRPRRLLGFGPKRVNAAAVCFLPDSTERSPLGDKLRGAGAAALRSWDKVAPEIRQRSIFYRFLPGKDGHAGTRRRAGLAARSIQAWPRGRSPGGMPLASVSGGLVSLAKDV